MSHRQCEVCGKEEPIPMKCNYCNKIFCAPHHLPEAHNCLSLPKVPPPYIGVKLEDKSTEVLHEIKRLEKRAIKKEKISLSTGKLALISLILIIIGCVFFVMLIDRAPPAIRIISPATKTYDVTISLTYTINEPTSWMGYRLNNAENITLTGNTTLSSLPAGRYNLTIYANDTAGNMGFSRVSFTVTNVFRSLDKFISFLREDDLSDAVWTINYTCNEFANDFIKRAEMKGYYCFTYCASWGNELEKYTDAVESIKVVKKYSCGTETRGYDVVGIGLGHAVCRTTIDGMDVIVDPQTDIILAMKDFAVLYEGEITQD